MCIYACLAPLDINVRGLLSKLDLSKNNLRSEGLSAVSEALKSTSIKQLNIADNNLMYPSTIPADVVFNLTYNQQGHSDMSGFIKFAEDMKDMGSLSKLDISSNSMYAEPMTLLAQALNGNTTLKELSAAGNQLDAEDAKVLAPAIQAMGSLSKLKMNKYELPVQEIKTATELDLSNKDLNYNLDAIVIAALIKVQTTTQNHLVTN
jgi:hypothetical protein